MPSSLHGLSLFHPQGHLARPSNPFGKDIANAALFRGLLNFGGFREVAVLNQIDLSADQLAVALESTEAICLRSASLNDTIWPAKHGTLLRGQPYLSDLAWLRRNAGLDEAYSLVGLIHTIAPPAVRQEIAAAALAPTHPWDALVCTSPAVQQAMVAMFDAQAEHFASRLGAIRAPRPRLPLIPLAVDTDRLAHEGGDQKARLALRERLSISEDDILVLWVGRLSYYEKAFPQSMFQAMRLASEQSERRMHFALVGWFPGGEAEMQLYEQAANHLAPDLNVLVMDGNDPITVAQSWAAADVFLSLVDNIQETFGLTPIEAMAAGLPVVVSDWDGYRYTVRDGVEGLLVPTLGSMGGRPGEWLSGLHSLGLETYQTYVGATAQHTAVHVQRAAAALVRLADSPDLRQAMGAAGQQRAQSMFSWPQVARLYRDLFEELADLRQAASVDDSAAGAHLHPSRGEPFADFKHFATNVLEADLVMRLSAGASPADLHDRLTIQLNGLYSGLRGTTEEASELLQRLEVAGNSGLVVDELCSGFPQERRPFLETTLVWLAKMDLVDWLPRN